MFFACSKHGQNGGGLLPPLPTLSPAAIPSPASANGPAGLRKDFSVSGVHQGASPSWRGGARSPLPTGGPRFSQVLSLPTQMARVHCVHWTKAILLHPAGIVVSASGGPVKRDRFQPYVSSDLELFPFVADLACAEADA